MIKRLFLLNWVMCFCMVAYGQQFRIEGTVVDKVTREPLEFVNVLVVGLGTGASTDGEGHFIIDQD